ncbi:uncharacterized protein PHALS_05341 [Plasmopara halstedii]|uniref:Uncharacterized protein n=1 Tax=Plasmopara halstedii TaxID=4781 RepID=A0A0P1AB93_PLAHL|nr:uncharacterized protein PHALS_05341 [Plasmopara halstedii]CEG37561.1 hypothetical protein PHALS_05341 [Plasmopara halstedii]|eukprot:XP_024573930.1 hypothetical protein PHALS_05341 [Plasmopara halstedii]
MVVSHGEYQSGTPYEAHDTLRTEITHACTGKSCPPSQASALLACLPVPAEC